MVERRLHPPPQPSLPREAPWREIEEIIKALNNLATKLDILISIYTGLPPGELPEGLRLLPTPNKPTFVTGQKDVLTAGEPEQLDDLAIPDGFAVTIIAKTANIGYIYWGRTASDCANTKRRGDGLSAGLAISLKIKNLSQVFVDASVQGTAAAPEGVSWTVEQPT